MFKRIPPLILAFLIGCSTSTTVFVQAEYLCVEEENAESDRNEKTAICFAASISPGTVAEDAIIAIDPDFMQTAVADPEYMDWLFGVPDEIRSASTMELLKYFMETSFMRQQVLSCSSTPDCRTVDLSCHEAFRELISREDFMDSLENYAGGILNDPESDEFEKAKLEKLLAHPLVKLQISDLVFFTIGYPSLRSICAPEVLPLSVGDYVGTINGIDYYSAGTISTANNCAVEVCTPNRELTPAEITYFNNSFNANGLIRLSEPTSVYNCHSYAWYRFSTLNPYWIMSISQFLNDSGCTPIAPTLAQAKDIIVYYNAYGLPAHSGVVYSVASSGELTICSKWGQAGVYLHALGSVPSEYYSNPSAGLIIYVIYRYHDYANQYTGNQYHSGIRHYYEYADICEVCNKQINPTWTSVICNGPPCPILRAKQKN